MKEEQISSCMEFCQNRGKIDEFMREMNLMISLPPHPNVVQMFGVFIEGTQPIIVMEYCSGGLSVNEKQTNKQTNKHITIYFSLSIIQIDTHNHIQIYIENTHCIVSFFLTFVCDWY
jgi:serine/threonine protein kinase